VNVTMRACPPRAAPFTDRLSMGVLLFGAGV
jgi:hypothetical protein